MTENLFTYCPLIWMVCLKADMIRVEKVQYKTLGAVYNNNIVIYDDLLALDNKLKIHQTICNF